MLCVVPSCVMPCAPVRRTFIRRTSEERTCATAGKARGRANGGTTAPMPTERQSCFGPKYVAAHVAEWGMCPREQRPHAGVPWMMTLLRCCDLPPAHSDTDSAAGMQRPHPAAPEMASKCTRAFQSFAMAAAIENLQTGKSEKRRRTATLHVEDCLVTRGFFRQMAKPPSPSVSRSSHITLAKCTAWKQGAGSRDTRVTSNEVTKGPSTRAPRAMTGS